MGATQSSNPCNSDCGCRLDWKKVFYEFLAMTLFVYIGCGAAMTNSAVAPGDTLADEDVLAWRVLVAFTFGIAIMVLVFATAHISGGQINSAVTLSLALTSQISWIQCLGNMLGQFLGSILGAILLNYTVARGTTLGSNGIQPAYEGEVYQTFLAEVFLTFVLCWVVLETAINTATVARSRPAANPVTAPIAIGFAVLLAHFVLLPVDGCSINPPRSFGPAIIAQMINHQKTLHEYWIFFFAPHVGGALAAFMYWCTHPITVADSIADQQVKIPLLQRKK